MTQGLCELLWLKIILDDLQVKWEGPMKLCCENKSAINIGHSPIQHIKIDKHFIRDNLEKGLVCTCDVPLQCQLAGVLTKCLSSSFHGLVSMLTVEDIYFSFRRSLKV